MVAPFNNATQTRYPPIILVRHGQSEGQLNQILYKTKGDHKLSLTDEGFFQATLQGNFIASIIQKFPIVRILTSHSNRTVQTAQKIYQGIQAKDRDVELFTEGALDKQKFGLFDGLFSSKERQEAYPELYAQYCADYEKLGEFAVRPPQGESIQDVYERCKQFLNSCRDTEKPIVLVTHGLPILCFQAIIEGREPEWILRNQDTIDNGSVFFVDRQAQENRWLSLVESADHLYRIYGIDGYQASYAQKFE